MYTTHNTLKVSDLRKRTTEVIKEIEQMEAPVTVFSRSQPKIVIMNFKIYKAMLQKPAEPAASNTGNGIDFFADPPKEFLIKERGLDAVKLIRAERNSI